MPRVKNVIFARDKQTRNAIIVDPINVYLFLVRPLGHWAKDYQKKPNKCNGFRNVIVERMLEPSSIMILREIITSTRIYDWSTKLDDSIVQQIEIEMGWVKRKVNRISDRTCYFSFREILVGSGNEFPDLQLTEIILNRSIYM